MTASDRDQDAATRLEIAAARLHPANQQIQPLNDPWPVVLVVTAIGVCGFVGLLVASHYLPTRANTLRVGALVWFVMFGVLRSALVRGRKAAPTRQDQRVN